MNFTLPMHTMLIDVSIVEMWKTLNDFDSLSIDVDYYDRFEYISRVYNDQFARYFDRNHVPFAKLAWRNQ